MKIIATDVALPNKIVSNYELAEATSNLVNPDWVRDNLGIINRRVADEDVFSSDLAAQAVNNLFEKENIDPDSIDMLIVATATPDILMPSCACAVQLKTNLKNAFCFDIAAVCSGFLFGLTTANNYLKSGMVKRAIIVGVDTFSKITDWSSRDCVFFGDGAGAVLLESSEDEGFNKSSNYHSVLHSSSSGFDAFKCRHGEKFEINSRLVKASASESVPWCIQKLFAELKISKDDVDVVVPHQPSIKLLQDVASSTGIDFKKFCINMDRYGNTAGATIPIALHEAFLGGRIKSGDNILFIAAGAGFTAGAAIYTHF